MGAPHDAFVPAAILLENPGITLEKFERKLRQVGPFTDSPSKGFGKNSALLFYKPYFSGSLALMGDILCLKSNLSPLESPEKDTWKIPVLEVHPRLGKRHYLAPTYNVNRYFGTRLGEPEIRTGADYGAYTIGGEIEWGLEKQHYFYLNGKLETVLNKDDGKNRFIIEEISPQEAIKHNGQEMSQSTLKLRRVIPVYTQEKFDTLQELIGAYPQFSPENLFDTNQKEGKLSVGCPFYIYLKWFKIGEGYHLDLKNIVQRKRLARDKLDPDSIYTSIVLTAEAINHRAWEMVSYAGGNERPGILAQFLMAHPSSKRRHDNQLMQFWDWKNTLEQGLTNNEWLRERAIAQWRRGLTRKQARREYALICEEAPQQIKEMENRRALDLLEASQFGKIEIDPSAETPFG